MGSITQPPRYVKSKNTNSATTAVVERDIDSYELLRRKSQFRQVEVKLPAQITHHTQFSYSPHSYYITYATWYVPYLLIFRLENGNHNLLFVSLVIAFGNIDILHVLYFQTRIKY